MSKEVGDGDAELVFEFGFDELSTTHSKSYETTYA